MNVELVTVSGKAMYRLTLPDGAIRTGAAPETLATLREATQAAHARRQRLRQDEAAGLVLIRHCIGTGADATEARADVARTQAAITEAAQEADRLEALAEEVSAAATEAYAAPLRHQYQAAIAATVAALPTIPGDPNA